ncbi:MAG: MBL fold metallo-hydrolase [Defluviitaleaceae bacterium]|nr:MBL fold metallo-hydrolase [Defluviitaleaceae bacterium]
MLRFCPIASGSSGNCIYVGAGGANILIDAGISGKRIAEGFSYLKMDCVDALFITHEHSDHIGSVGVFARRYNTPIYATQKTWRFLIRHNVLGPIERSLMQTVTPGSPVRIGGAEITAFEIPHDAVEPVGYAVRTGGYKAVVATDIGHVTDVVRKNAYDSDILFLESNHDLEMLKNGRYSRQLKERVMGLRGHLSNVSAGELLAEAATERLKQAYLGHLSEENNRPMIAIDTVRRILDGRMVEVRELCVAERNGPGELTEIP